MQCKARCSSHQHGGWLLPPARARRHCREPERGGKGSTAEYHPLGCGLCSKEGNCPGRNLCFNIFLFVCLKQVPTSLRKSCSQGNTGVVLSSFILHCLLTFSLPTLLFCVSLFLSFFARSLTFSLVHLLLQNTCISFEFCSRHYDFLKECSGSQPEPFAWSCLSVFGNIWTLWCASEEGGKGAEVAEEERSRNISV